MVVDEPFQQQTPPATPVPYALPVAELFLMIQLMRLMEDPVSVNKPPPNANSAVFSAMVQSIRLGEHG